MLNIKLDQSNGVAVLTPDAPLSASDFEHANRVINDYLAEHPSLNGVIIEAKHFPGWQDMAGMVSHFRFVRDHHKDIRRVAMVSDGALLTLVPHLADHFVSAEVKHFNGDDLEGARRWVTS